MGKHTYKRKKSGGGIIWLLLAAIIVLGALWYSGELDLSFLHKDPWNLTLVNRSNAVPESWECELTELKNGENVDSRIYPYLQEMFDACRADGLLPMVMSGYRTDEDQQKMFDEKVNEFVAAGYSEDEAREQASDWAARPGYSEHQLGLAVDIDSDDLSVCSNESVWEWMKAHCDEYGFILRYPEGKEDVTGYSYEQWHFRYVGKEAAKAIMDSGVTLEEYIAKQKK